MEPIIFKPGNRVMFNQEYALFIDPVLITEQALKVETVRQVSEVYPFCGRKSYLDCQYGNQCHCKISAESVGHPQWVTLDIPGVGRKEFSGAHFKMAPGGRLNELEIKI